MKGADFVKAFVLGFEVQVGFAVPLPVLRGALPLTICCGGGTGLHGHPATG